jgi:SulP family sulfate permease
MTFSLQEFTPKTWICLKEGYSLKQFITDLLAGFTVGAISIPLTMAFAIASGVSPEKGLITGIVAGFLISLLGGSRVQIGGPTGAFAVIVYSVVVRHGIDGLILATFMAGLIMTFLAFSRAGVLLKFIPYSVTTGFTAGIALTIFSSQIKDLFGLQMDSIPIDFFDKWSAYFHAASSYTSWAIAISALCIFLLFGMKRYFPKWPAPLFTVILGTGIVWIFSIPVETVQTKFGGIPSDLFSLALPDLSLDKLQAVFPEAITIALLGSIESLLSAVIADGITGHRHRSNTELFAQGIANIGSSLFGGIPATGAIARTAANIRLGAKTPIAGMFHAVTMLILVLFFATIASQIPLPVLAAILVYVAWNMSEFDHIKTILKTTKSDIVILLLTFALTVLIDLTVAVQVGVLIAAVLFMKKMADTTSMKVCQILIHQEDNPHLKDSDTLLRKDIPEGIVVFEIDGPLFFGSAFTLTEPLSKIAPSPKVFILRLHKVPLIDASGAHSLKDFTEQCAKKGISLILSGVDDKKADLLLRSGVEKKLPPASIFHTFHDALQEAKVRLLNQS